MKKNLLMIILMGFFIVSLTACTNSSEKVSDAKKFKEEYESLNGIKNENGNTIRTVTIDEDNPMIYKNAEDIVEMVHKKETFVVYFGFAKCPWCRSVITNLIKASKDLGIDNIYYVDILEIRDTLKINDDGKVVTEKKGTEGYYDLLKIFDSVLSDYSLGDDIDTGEKRIYAPNIISVVKGKVQSLTEGISEKQTDAYMKLTSDMLEESYQLIKCTIQCVADENNTCSAKKMC